MHPRNEVGRLRSVSRGNQPVTNSSSSQDLTDRQNPHPDPVSINSSSTPSESPDFIIAILAAAANSAGALGPVNDDHEHEAEGQGSTIGTADNGRFYSTLGERYS
jgi:hypothetical protein